MGVMLRRHALARSTNAKYSAHWKQWRQFAEIMKWSPVAAYISPPSFQSSQLFRHLSVKYGWNNAQYGNQYSTIQGKIASIVWYHRHHLGVSLRLAPRLHIVLRGIKRLSDPVRKMQPITPAFFRRLRRSLDVRVPRQRLLWGSVLIGYFFLLRRSEYLRVGNHRSFYCLKTSNVFFSDIKGVNTDAESATSVTIGLEGSKNDQYGRGAWRTMHTSGDKLLCPVKALRHILQARMEMRATSEHLCHDLTSASVANAIKATASAAGVAAANYATHSIRIGGATALLSERADSLSIKLLGRWLSRCYEDYPVQAAAATTDLARRMT